MSSSPPSSQPPLIVFLDRASFPAGLTFGRPKAAHRWIDHDATPYDQVADRLQGAAVAVTNKIPIDAATIAACPDLKLIAVTATGTDRIDKVAAAAHGIAVRNVVNYGSESVAEHALALLLSLTRQIAAYSTAVLDGSWTRSGQFCVFPRPILDLAGRRLALLGSGSIAQAVAVRARAFGMEVVFAERKGAPPRDGRVSFDEALSTADVISLHCPLTEDTRDLLDTAAFARMKRGVIVLNTARGGLIDEAALEAALDAGIVGGAGLDVTVVEPPAADARILRLAARPEVIVTPHSAWASPDALGVLTRRVIDSIDAYLSDAN